MSTADTGLWFNHFDLRCKELEARRGTNEAEVAKRIFEWSHTRATYIWWGEGKTSGSFVPMLMHKGRKHQLFAVWTYGVFEFYFQYYQCKPPFEPEEKRLELLERLNSIPGVSVPADGITRRPKVSLSSLNDETALKQLLETFDGVIQEIKAS